MSHTQPVGNLETPQSEDAPLSTDQQQGLVPLNGHAEPAAKAKEAKASYMSLPHKGQLAILCIARLADPLATTSIQVREALSEV